MVQFNSEDFFFLIMLRRCTFPSNLAYAVNVTFPELISLADTLFVLNDTVTLIFLVFFALALSSDIVPSSYTTAFVAESGLRAVELVVAEVLVLDSDQSVEIRFEGGVACSETGDGRRNLNGFSGS
ncbi:hypothetical protein M0R45_038140 [Rubus argutus]|uniref:Uncharacterized protein n=1 Tax=Rubus argutus TaxID=59490 RepID=A0AAW1W2K6_RUBAR